MNSNDLIKFKEEILNRLNENENKIVEIQSFDRKVFESKMNIYEKNIEEFNLRLADMHNITISQKEKIEKINDLQKFQKETEEDLFNQEINIKNLQKDLTNSCAKYDRHYLENLIIPGLVGDYCKYKNLREFVEVRSF